MRAIPVDRLSPLMIPPNGEHHGGDWWVLTRDGGHWVHWGAWPTLHQALVDKWRVGADVVVHVRRPAAEARRARLIEYAIRDGACSRRDLLDALGIDLPAGWR